MAREWDAATALIQGPALKDLGDWLKQFGLSPQLQRAMAACRGARLNADRLVAGLIVGMSDGQQSGFRGFSVLRSDLPLLARQAIERPGAERAAVAALLESGSLGAYQQLPGCADYESLDALWQRLVAEATRRLQGDVPPILRERLPRDLAAAHLLLAQLDGSERERLSDEAAEVSGSISGVTWYRQLTEHGATELDPARHLLAVVAGGMARAQADTQRREAERQRETQERHRTVVRARWDRRIAQATGIALLTFILPFQLGQHLWAPTVDGSVSGQKFWPAVSGLIEYLPSYVFGSLILLGIAGGLMLLLPPRRRQSAPRVLVIAPTLLAALAAPAAAGSTRQAFIDAGWTAYTVGPISEKAIGPTCGSPWTAPKAVEGAYDRYALVLPDERLQGCRKIQAYHAWQETWSYPAPAKSSMTQMLAYFSDGVIVIRQDTPGNPGKLIGLKSTNGKVKWQWQCPSKKAGYPNSLYGMSSSVPNVYADCADRTYVISIETGKANR